MDEKHCPISDETLDPQDWQSLRRLGHRMLDDAMDYLETIEKRPVWQPIPSAVKTSLQQPLPQDPQGEEAVYREFVENILPHPMGNIHPRFWGWVIGTGTPFGMLAEMLAACMNPNLGGADHVANYVEAQVLAWCREMLGYPADAGGLLVSGCSMANLVGLTVARNTKARGDIRRRGLHVEPVEMVLYGSEEIHNSIQKAVELFGLGREALRRIPVNRHYQMDTAALQKAIAADRAAGRHPFCIVANAGTVNTGAVDDLDRLADICASEDIWFHVDGAFGALAALAPSKRHLVAGLARADSLAFDLHKWMYMPLEIGCILVRDEKAHRGAFATTTDYLDHGGERGLIGGAHWYGDYGVQLSRGFRALKAWMSIKAYGIEKYGRMIEENIRQAAYLAERVDAHPRLERCAPVPLNIVCFRYVAPGLEEEALNALNRELLIRLHEGGVAVPSYTTLSGRYVLRAAITNHRSRGEDFDRLVDEVERVGDKLCNQMECKPSLGQNPATCWFGSPPS